MVPNERKKRKYRKIMRRWNAMTFSVTFSFVAKFLLCLCHYICHFSISFQCTDTFVLQLHFYPVYPGPELLGNINANCIKAENAKSPPICCLNCKIHFTQFETYSIKMDWKQNKTRFILSSYRLGEKPHLFFFSDKLFERQWTDTKA